MKIKTNEVHVVEKEIELPYYYKLTYDTLPATYYALITEDKAIRVDSGREIYSCSTTSVTDGLGKPNFEECSKDEFDSVFSETQNYFLQTLNQY